MIAPTFPDFRGYLALIKAIGVKDPVGVAIILLRFRDLNDTSRTPPLHFAAWSLSETYRDRHPGAIKRMETIVRILLANGAKDVPLPPFHSHPSIFYQCLHNSYFETAKFLKKLGIGLDSAFPPGSSYLHAAAYFNQKWMLDGVPNLKELVNRQNESGRTPLHTAIYTNHPEIVIALLENGASLDIKDNQGVTPSDERRHYLKRIP